jgi:hypothetical protein
MKVRVTGADKLQRLSKELKAAGDPGKGLRKELLKEIRDAGKPTVQKVRQAAQALPGESDKELRQAIASGVAVRTKLSGKNAGIHIIVRRARLPQGKERVPRLMNRGKWRHPVFGRDVWVDQVSEPGWFDEAVRGDANRFRKAVLQAIANTNNKIKRSI